MYFLLLYEWWVPLIKFIIELTIHVREGSTHLSTPGVPNNFPERGCAKCSKFSSRQCRRSLRHFNVHRQFAYSVEEELQYGPWLRSRVEKVTEVTVQLPFIQILFR